MQASDDAAPPVFSPGVVAGVIQPGKTPPRSRPEKAEKRKSCNCRNSRCLKLYCECFASGQYCFACNCQGCHNNPENDEKRKRAIDATLERWVVHMPPQKGG